MNLHQIDLNLLVLFDALYKHRSVSIAADEICISQSAFSHGLNRLRERLDDPLFIRIKNVMQPTTRATQIALKLNQALPTISSALSKNEPFNAKTSTMNFKFVATDYTELSLLPKLIGAINNKAPNISITVLPATEQFPLARLENGEVDFTLGFSHQLEKSSSMESYTWLEDSYCTIARKNHPVLTNGLTIENFLKLPHVRVSPWGEKQGVVDQVLNKMKLQRQVILQLPSVLVAPYTILHSDSLLTIPRRIAELLATQINIELFEPPITLPNYQLNIYWHRLNASKVSYQWLIEQIKMLHKSQVF
ncbi:MAG: LysR family transcriptional regulator [Colwellia sp.]|nr:LysR family transcriptional regulator [Colwellia sp.]